jgi:nitroreductase
VLVIPFYSRQAYLERYGRPDKAAAGLRAEAAWPAPYWLIDTAFATMLLLLGAADIGLGALLFRLHGSPAALGAALGVPDGWEPVGAVALGWPAEDDSGSLRPPRRLRPMNEVLHRGGW